MAERENILSDIVEALRDTCQQYKGMYEIAEYDEFLEGLADAALRVIERPQDAKVETYDAICTCGQSGFPENSPHSNHPHTEDCPQYTGRKDVSHS